MKKLLPLVLAVTCSCNDQTGRIEGARSGIAILVDFSQSFAPLTAQDLASLTTIGQAVRNLALRADQQPSKMQWLAITEESKRAPSLCGGPRVFKQKLTNLGYVSPEYITTSVDLVNWLAKACPDSVVAQSKNANAPFTDITGAVSLASESLNAVGGQRILIVYSDFLEDLPKSENPVMPSLQRYRVLLVWRPGVDTSRNMDARLKLWVERFKTAGARTCVQPAISLIPDDVVACLTQESR